MIFWPSISYSSFELSMFNVQPPLETIYIYLVFNRSFWPPSILQNMLIWCYLPYHFHWPLLVFSEWLSKWQRTAHWSKVWQCISHAGEENSRNGHSQWTEICWLKGNASCSTYVVLQNEGVVIVCQWALTACIPWHTHERSKRVPLPLSLRAGARAVVVA